MDDDKTDGAVTPPNGPRKRPPPTIDLTASDVSESAPASDDAASAPRDAGPQADAPRAAFVPSMIVSAAAGAVAALLIIGGAWLAGWPGSQIPTSAMPPQQAGSAPDKAALEALGARVARMESNAAKPAAASSPAVDPAMTRRIDALEKSIASLRDDVAAARGQSEKAVAAIGEIKSAPPEAVPASSPDAAGIEERLGKIERATVALTAVATTPAAPVPQAPPAEDPRLRRVAAATALDVSVRQGEPYASALAAARSASDNPDALKPLDLFAAAGVPSASALCRELLTLLPKLATKPEAAAAPSGMLERLQQSALRLVRVQRVDAAASSNSAILARATSAAQRNDVEEARSELKQLAVADRAAVQGWIDKADARDAALAASRQFASETMTALSKPAR
ncbi:MAG: hypothetical protein V4661_14060 [Pseudomonadota bacterium]